MVDLNYASPPIPVLIMTTVGCTPVRRIHRVLIMGWDRKFNSYHVDHIVAIDGYCQLAAQDTDCIKHQMNEVYCSITYSAL